MYEIIWPITPETTVDHEAYAFLTAPQIDAVRYLHAHGQAGETKTQEELQSIYDSLPPDIEWVCPI